MSTTSVLNLLPNAGQIFDVKSIAAAICFVIKTKTFSCIHFDFYIIIMNSPSWQLHLGHKFTVDKKKDFTSIQRVVLVAIVFGIEAMTFFGPLVNFMSEF